ncbi:hypothetical protein [Thiolapillus sp.]
MNSPVDSLELVLLEELAREEVEFWETYIWRCLEEQGEPLPPKAILALARAEDKLAFYVRLLTAGEAGEMEDRMH